MNSVTSSPWSTTDNAKISGNTYAQISPGASLRDIDDKMTMTREELDAKLDRGEAKIEASEARIASYMANSAGELSAIKATLAHVPSTWTLIGSIATGVVAAVSIVLAVMSYGGDRFDGGVQMTSASVIQAEEARRLATENSLKIEALTTSVTDLTGVIRAAFEKNEVKPSVDDAGQ